MRRVRETTTQETATKMSKPTGRRLPLALRALALGSLALAVLLAVVLLLGLGSALPTSGIEADPFIVTIALMTAGTLLIGAATLWWIEAAHGSPDRCGKSDRPARS